MATLYKKRIEYEGDLKDISEAICKTYALGSFVSNKPILIGYEDFNFSLDTTKGNYFVKVFANFRSDDDCKKCVDVVLNSLNAGVSTPRLLKSNKDYLIKLKINNSNLRLCVMDYIEGKTIYENNEKLSNDEIKFIAKQAALINSINFKPFFTYDSWAISNFLKEFKEKNKYLSKKDFETLKPLVNDFKQLKIEELPHCFVHGDIISTNVIKDKKGKLWVIDFSVSNYYPRIQELAVLACDLLFNPKDKNESDSNLNIALKEYQKKIRLTKRELRSLPVYVKLAHSMHVLCASHAKKALNNTSEENECYLEKGRAGLEQMVN